MFWKRESYSSNNFGFLIWIFHLKKIPSFNLVWELEQEFHFIRIHIKDKLANKVSTVQVSEIVVTVLYAVNMHIEIGFKIYKKPIQPTSKEAYYTQETCGLNGYCV